MKYLYHEDAGKEHIDLTGDNHKYIFRVRRHQVGDTISLRNLKDNSLYRYTIEKIDKKSSKLLLHDYKNIPSKPGKLLHIGWCIIDPKNIEKTLPHLNELGIARITFLYCDRSQKQYKIDIERMRKILLSSSQQCGRTSMMNIEMANSIDSFLKSSPDAYILNFTDLDIGTKNDISTILVGCEGGFTDREMALFEHDKVVGLETELTLRSQTAAIVLASKILL